MDIDAAEPGIVQYVLFQNLAVGDDNHEVAINGINVFEPQTIGLQNRYSRLFCDNLYGAGYQPLTPLPGFVWLADHRDYLVIAFNECLQVARREVRRTGEDDVQRIRLAASGFFAAFCESVASWHWRDSRQRAFPQDGPFRAVYIRPAGLQLRG